MKTGMSNDSKSHYPVYMGNQNDNMPLSVRTKHRTVVSPSSTPTIKVEQYPHSPVLSPSGNISQFLAKLWRLVNDEQTDSKISWTDDGRSFVVKDQASFSIELLPRYFKHHNFSSFVRQLNMYGFRKVVNTEQGGLRCTKDDYQFENKNFIRDRPDLLELVKRKPSTSSGPMHSVKEVDEAVAHSIKKLLHEVHTLRKDNERVKKSYETLKEEHAKIYQELEKTNEKSHTNTKAIQKIGKFLWSIVHPRNTLDGQPIMLENGERRQPFQEMIEPSTSAGGSWSSGEGSRASAGKLSDKVNKTSNDLQTIHNFLAQNMGADEMFESDYISPAVSPGPSSSYNGSAVGGPLYNGSQPPSPTPSNYSVHVEQFQEESVPPDMSMTSPSYIQHPPSPTRDRVHMSPVRSPVHQVTPVSPTCSSAHTSPHVSPYVSPHVSPYVSPHLSPSRRSPSPSNTSYAQMSYAGSPQMYCQNQQSSPVQYTYPVDPYTSPGKSQQRYPPQQPAQYKQGGLSAERPVVKKPKLSAYTQEIQWEDEEEEEEENVSIDPSSFFSK